MTNIDLTGGGFKVNNEDTPIDINSYPLKEAPADADLILMGDSEDVENPYSKKKVTKSGFLAAVWTAINDITTALLGKAGLNGSLTENFSAKVLSIGEYISMIRSGASPYLEMTLYNDSLTSQSYITFNKTAGTIENPTNTPANSNMFMFVGRPYVDTGF